MKQILKELSWLILPLLAVFAIYPWLGSGSLDINFHDTYFVIAPKYFLFFLYIITAFFIYLIKESAYRYKRKVQNSILIFFGFSLILIIALPFMSF